MITRKLVFVAQALLCGATSTALGQPAAALQQPAADRPVVISTWQHGFEANAVAWEVLAAGGRALDAVEAGVRNAEADPSILTVGLGGLPDREGNVTLDACLMDETGACGSVACLSHIAHPVSVARRVMETTPHVMLVGEGALEFALANGFPKREPITERARLEWEKWKSQQPGAIQEGQINIENHDTIGMLALDKEGRLSGACSTSGMAWKLKGRVGDSPIIGAGLYVDNEVGAATATGTGEAVIRAVGTFLVVELMRQGNSPQDACRMATERVIAKNPNWKELQVGFIALDKQGRVGGYAIQPGFDYGVYKQGEGNRLLKAASRIP
jgi:L-asparaginase/N4-(beta-N-acetylglucosaminyl)-L-asparaginase